MKLGRVRTETGEIRYFRSDSNGAVLLSGFPRIGHQDDGEEFELDEAHLVEPVVPGIIFAVGRNYGAHAAEMGHSLPAVPSVFVKATSSVTGPGTQIVLPPESDEVHHEAELAIVIGAVGRRIAAKDVERHILGYTCANDVSARDLQRSDVHVTRGKGFDTFCPLGPWVETAVDPNDLQIKCLLNDEIRQDGHTSDMIFKPAFLVEFISQFTTLRPGDVILTGSPAGTSALAEGDTVRVEVEGIGSLTNSIRNEY